LSAGAVASGPCDQVQGAVLVHVADQDRRAQAPPICAFQGERRVREVVRPGPAVAGRAVLVDVVAADFDGVGADKGVVRATVAAGRHGMHRLLARHDGVLVVAPAVAVHVVVPERVGAAGVPALIHVAIAVVVDAVRDLDGHGMDRRVLVVAVVLERDAVVVVVAPRDPFEGVWWLQVGEAAHHQEEHGGRISRPAIDLLSARLSHGRHRRRDIQDAWQSPTGIGARRRPKGRPTTPS
jgi:hypothetical protein